MLLFHISLWLMCSSPIITTSPSFNLIFWLLFSDGAIQVIHTYPHLGSREIVYQMVFPTQIIKTITSPRLGRCNASCSF